HDYSGTPLLLVRQTDGSLRAFLNVCRHRGARLANGSGRGLRNLVCPYHAWCYGSDGKLLARPDERSFAEIDKSARGLCERAVVEKYGMIWVSPTTPLQFDPDALLRGLSGISGRMVSVHTLIMRHGCFSGLSIGNLLSMLS